MAKYLLIKLNVMESNFNGYDKMNKIGIAAITLSMFIGTQAFAGVITSSSDLSLNGATTIDFNSETLGSFSSKTFNGDVTFTPTSGTMNVETTHSGSYGSTGAYLGNPSGQNFDINFTNAVSAFGFSWGAADQSWAMSLFDISDVLIDTINITAQTNPYIGFIGANDTGISKVTMTSNSSYDYFLLDDFQYVTETTTSVPAPASILFLGLGLAGIGISRKKKTS